MTPTVVQPIVEDPGPPYLFFDLYPWDLDNPRTPQLDDPDVAKVINVPHLCGGILKATDGTAYRYTDWFARNFGKLKTIAQHRYASSWWRGGYHYLQFFQDGALQADYYCSTVEDAGGWDDGVIMPIVDVEFGPERAANHRASTVQIMDCVAAFADRARRRTGRRVMLYGRSVMRDRGIATKMGCNVVWNPAYTARMVVNGLTTLPDGGHGAWNLDDIVLWQYGGDGTGDASVHHLPLKLPGFGAVDLSAHVAGAHRPSLETLRAGLI